MIQPLVRKAALDLAIERGLVSDDGGGQEDLGDYARRGAIDIETMKLLEREAELLLNGRYPEYGNEPTALMPDGPEPPPIPRLGLYPWKDWSRFKPEVFLGEGGMGRVFRVQDIRLKRRVALKFFRAALDNAAKVFLREAQSQARIDHPNVAKVFEAGEQEGIPFLSMQHIQGPTLSEAAPGLDLREKVELVRQAALGVHAAHRLGIVHRDLKPGNIMLERDEQGHWKAFVMDFGLARDLADTPTGMTAVMGTPAYMSPEQIEGPSVLVGPHSDIYALGVTLFGLLAGCLPFVGSNQAEIFRLIVEADAPSLRKIDPTLPKELEGIVQHCMERDVLRRYDSALELAEDLERFLAGRSVRASPVGAWERSLKRVRRNPLPVLSLSAVLLLSGGWLAYALATRSRERALGLRVEAQSQDLSRILLELEQLKSRQAEERRRSENLLREVAQAPTPAARQQAEELLQASQLREQELAKQVEEAKQRIPSPANSEANGRPSAANAEPGRAAAEPSQKEPDPRVEASAVDQAGRNPPAAEAPAYAPPRVLYLASGRYPSRALSDTWNPYRRHEVSILLRVQVDANGKPDKITVLQDVPGSLGYSESAMDVIRRSTFEPAMKAGKPVPGSIDIQVKFTKAAK
ncbi:MAG: TonB family protein [Holophagaceae bacterium]|nr:TonB family protein [Holophagaceae bacterium]